MGNAHSESLVVGGGPKFSTYSRRGKANFHAICVGGNRKICRIRAYNLPTPRSLRRKSIFWNFPYFDLILHSLLMAIQNNDMGSRIIMWSWCNLTFITRGGRVTCIGVYKRYHIRRGVYENIDKPQRCEWITYIYICRYENFCTIWGGLSKFRAWGGGVYEKFSKRMFIFKKPMRLGT